MVPALGQKLVLGWSQSAVTLQETVAEQEEHLGISELLEEHTVSVFYKPTPSN